MATGAGTPTVEVFLSYRRMDNPRQGAYDGRVTLFRDALKAEISSVIGAGNTTVFMDTDPETMIGDKTWRDKILRQLAATTVFVSIITANYLESRGEHACSWEFSEYMKLYDANPGRHSMIAIQLCDPDVAGPILASTAWSSLGRQEIIEYEKCRDAWREGPGHASWGKLVGGVADAVIAFAKQVPPSQPPSAATLPSRRVSESVAPAKFEILAPVAPGAVWSAVQQQTTPAKPVVFAGLSGEPSHAAPMPSKSEVPPQSATPTPPKSSAAITASSASRVMIDPYGRAIVGGYLWVVTIWGLWGWSMAQVPTNLWWLIGCIGLGAVALISTFIFLLEDPVPQLLVVSAATISTAGGIMLLLFQAFPASSVSWWPPDRTVWTWAACITAGALWLAQLVVIRHKHTVYTRIQARRSSVPKWL